MPRQFLYSFLFFLFLINTAALFAQAKYEGFGANTPGGKGKQIVHVKNLNAKGPGSLYAAMGSNRIIVFDIGGTIDNFRWDSSDEFSVSNLTIDGSTAPAPGITLNNNNNGNGLSFQDGCHDIIVKNIRVRDAGNDGFSVVNAHDIVFDHVSSSGSRDGGLDITAGAYNVTVQWSIFGPVTSPSSGPMLIAYTPTKNISIHHNLFNSRGSSTEGARNPLIHSSNGAPVGMMADFRNNVVWNWGNSKTDPCCGYGYGTGVDHAGTANIISNFYQTDGSQAENTIDFNHESKGAKGYVAGNISGNKGINPNKLTPWPTAPVTTQDACEAAAKVLAEAGPRPLDATDQAIIREISLINCPVNKPPVVNAGNDIILTLPVNSVTLNGSGSDPDGKITSYAWTKISGPKNYTLKGTNTAKVAVSNLKQGIYVFSLTVTDNRRTSITDSITVTVKPANGSSHKK
jgi:hypothetical protein